MEWWSERSLPGNSSHYVEYIEIEKRSFCENHIVNGKVVGIMRIIHDFRKKLDKTLMGRFYRSFFKLSRLREKQFTRNYQLYASIPLGPRSRIWYNNYKESDPQFVEECIELAKDKKPTNVD